MAGLKNGKGIGRSVTGDIFEQPDTIRGFIGARDNEVKIAIPIGITGDGPSPKPDPQIDGEPRMIVGQFFQALGSGPTRNQQQTQ